MKLLLEIFGAMFGALRSALVVIFLIASLLGNFFLITSSSVHSFASSLFEMLPIKGIVDNSLSTRNKKLEAENKKFRNENRKLIAERKVRLQKLSDARKISRKIAKRTVRNVTANLTSMVGEATPYIGIGLVVASTFLDVKDGCDTMRDVNEILVMLEDDQGEDANQVCGVSVPTVEEITISIKDKVGGTLHQSEENIRESAKELYDALGGTTYHSTERVKEGTQKIYDALGGTLYEIFN